MLTNGSTSKKPLSTSPTLNPSPIDLVIPSSGLLQIKSETSGLLQIKSENTMTTSVTNPLSLPNLTTNQLIESFNVLDMSRLNASNAHNNNNALVSTSNNNSLSNSFQFSYEFREEQDKCLQLFEKWSPIEQNEFVENLLRRMCHFQHGHIYYFLKPMLQRDFISSLPGKLIKTRIYLDYF